MSARNGACIVGPGEHVPSFNSTTKDPSTTLNMSKDVASSTAVVLGHTVEGDIRMPPPAFSTTDAAREHTITFPDAVVWSMFMESFPDVPRTLRSAYPTRLWASIDIAPTTSTLSKRACKFPATFADNVCTRTSRRISCAAASETSNDNALMVVDSTRTKAVLPCSRIVSEDKVCPLGISISTRHFNLFGC